MKALMTALVFGTLSAPAFATSIPNSGLECTLTYSSTDALSTYQRTTNAWIVAGKTLAGEAKVNENGYPGNAAANTIAISKAQVDGQDFWKVKVLDGKNGKAIGVFSFPPEAGMKATFAVDAIDDEVEDPATFQKLDVTCAFTVFAG